MRGARSLLQGYAGSAPAASDAASTSRDGY
jgi:hypothetical protein